MSVRHASRSIVDALPLARPSNYVCKQCRRNFQPVNNLSQQRRYASDRPESSNSSDLPLAERVRRKLWKGKPPGPENVDEVYGKGFIDTMREDRLWTAKQEAELQDVEAKLEKAEADLKEARDDSKAKNIPVPDAESERMPEESEENYTPARNWDGLRAVGYKDNDDWKKLPKRKRPEHAPWRELPIKEQDEYTPWLKASKPPSRSYEELVSILEQVTAEVRGSGGLTQGGLDLDSKLDMSQPSSFQILKRFSAIVSYRIPDPLITALAAPGAHGITLSGLLRAIEENIAPKPANLAERLQGDELLAAQSNLLILGRRETPVDKEKEVGRWKIIEAELRARGLPVLGKAEVQR